MNDKQELFELPIKKAILKFVGPCILSQVVAMIHSLADTFFVGQTGDPNQVAGLSLCFPIYMIMTAVANLFGIGANSSISRFLGAQQPKRAKKVSAFALWVSVIVIAVISAVLLIFMKPILTGVGASSATYEHASGYVLWVIVIGGIPTVAEMVIANMLRAEGMAKKASTGLMLGGVVNIILDPIFISVFGLGALGAGIATFIANLAALVYLLFCIWKTRDTTVLSLHPKDMGVSGAVAKNVLLVGLPAFLVVILGCTANMVLNHFMTSYGDVNMAAFGIVQKVGNLTVQIVVGIATGIMPLLGYHYAAGNPQKVREICMLSFIIVGAFTVICVLIYEVFAKYLIMAFIDDAETIRIGADFLRRWILCAPGMCFCQVFNAIFQGLGFWKQSTALSFVRQGVVLMPMLVILEHVIGMYGLVFAAPVADTTALILGFILYARVSAKTLKTEKA